MVLVGGRVVVAALQSAFSIASTRVSVSSALRSVDDDLKLIMGLGVTKADTACNRYDENSSKDDIVTSFIALLMMIMR